MKFQRVFVGDFRIDDDEKNAILNVIQEGRISEWKQVKEFERVFANYIGTKYCVAVNSGTSALIAGLCALLYDNRFKKAKKGAKVITTPLTYISTVNSIVLAGFEPVFVDIDKRTFKLNTVQIQELLENGDPEEYAGIIPVHVMGYPNDMNEINAIAERYDLFVFEDSAQAHGTIYNNKKAGALGLLAAFSFYIAHNIQAGEMGCVTTDDEKIFKLLIQLKANGRLCDCPVCTRSKGVCPGVEKYGYDEKEDYDPRFTHEYISYNFKTTEFTAALGVSQVKKADWIFQKRQENVNYLNRGLKQFKNLFYLPVFDSNVSYLAYPVTIRENSVIARKSARKMLETEGVENRPLFGCVPAHQPAYSYLKDDYRGRLPVAEYLGTNSFYIGCHQYLEREDLDYIIHVFNKLWG